MKKIAEKLGFSPSVTWFKPVRVRHLVKSLQSAILIGSRSIFFYSFLINQERSLLQMGHVGWKKMPKNLCFVQPQDCNCMRAADLVKRLESAILVGSRSIFFYGFLINQERSLLQMGHVGWTEMPKNLCFVQPQDCNCMRAADLVKRLESAIVVGSRSNLLHSFLINQGRYLLQMGHVSWTEIPKNVSSYFLISIY